MTSLHWTQVYGGEAIDEPKPSDSVPVLIDAGPPTVMIDYDAMRMRVFVTIKREILRNCVAFTVPMMLGTRIVQTDNGRRIKTDNDEVRALVADAEAYLMLPKGSLASMVLLDGSRT